MLFCGVLKLFDGRKPHAVGNGGVTRLLELEKALFEPEGDVPDRTKRDFANCGSSRRAGAPPAPG